VANDLLEETLILLLRIVPYQGVTTVLDTSYTPVEQSSPRQLYVCAFLLTLLLLIQVLLELAWRFKRATLGRV
jgi:hypothetical protein